MGEAAKNHSEVCGSGESERSRTRFPRYMTLIDCELVELEHDENADRVDELLEQLKKSVQVNCKHPIEERHVRHRGTPFDDDDDYEEHRCGVCEKVWDVFPEEER